MIQILIAVLLTFISFYLSCFDYKDFRIKKYNIVFFVLISIYLRLLVPINLNNDYYYYYDFRIFNKPNDFLSFFINEPYLYSVYSFFNFFIGVKDIVFLCMYWFNFLIGLIFFIWLLNLKDIEIWKKMVLFVLHYFLLIYVVLRNGPAYILFAAFFYYSFRNKKFNWILVTPFMHISSFLILVTYFHTHKYYYLGLFLGLTFIISSFFFLSPFLIDYKSFQPIIYKILEYSQGIRQIGILHIVFYLFILVLSLYAFIFYKKEICHPIVLTTMLFYFVSFFINPVVAHRFSPYILFALMLFPINTFEDTKKIFRLNFFSIFFFPIFLFTLFNTHHSKMFMSIFVK